MVKTKEALFNPALLLSVGLFPLIMVSVDLKSALIYAALVFLTWFLTFLLISAFRLIIGEQVRFICYALVVVAVIYLLDSAVYELFPRSYDSTSGIILSLFGSSVVFYELERTKDAPNFKTSFVDSFYVILSYVLSCVGVGLLREFLSRGQIFGKTLFPNFVGLSFFGELAGGLLVLVVIAFIHNILVGIYSKRKQTMEYLKERYSSVIEENLSKEDQ